MGCSIAGASDAPDAAEQTSQAATAVVVVERTSGPGDVVRGDTLVARFVRVHQGTVDDQALRIAGAAWDLPAVGTCSVSPSPNESAATTTDTQAREVALLDVGALTLDDGSSSQSRQAPRSTTLLPRTMFDPTGGVSGVFYTSHSEATFTPASRVQLRTTGGADLPDAFVVDVGAPKEITDLDVTTTAGGLDLTWEAPSADESSQDLVYVDVLSPAGRLVSRCTTTDTGHFVSPISTITPEEGQIAVHRLHRESFRTKGIEPGEIRFDVARVVTFRR